MKTLYLPIHQPGFYHERSVANKRGLYNALARAGACVEIDYLSIPYDKLYGTIWAELTTSTPDVLFLQVGEESFTPAELASYRRQFPDMAIVSWNGDYWPEHLTNPDMLALLKQVDLQLVVNGSVLETYQREGINAALCPFGFETCPDAWLKPAPRYDVVFCGNNYSPERQRLYEVLRGLPCNAGVYGVGWAQADGETNYDFAQTTALYSRAKIVISDNQFPDAMGYMSDRPIQAMYAGALVFQQRVAQLEALTGLQDGTHFIGFDTLDELPDLIGRWLSPDKDVVRAKIALEAQRFVLHNHSWDNRVRMIFEELLPKVRARV